MFEVKRDLEKIIKRHIDFVELSEVERPLFCVWPMGRNWAAAYKKTFRHIPADREVVPDDIVTEDYIQDVDMFINWAEEAGVEFFFPVVPYFYIPWTEAIIGCPIFAGKDSFYAEPFLKSWDDFNGKVDLSENNRWLSKLIEMKKALVEHLEDRYPIGSSTHLRGPADMMAAALGQREFPLELYDNPDRIKEMARIYAKAFVKIARILNDLARRSGFKGFVVNNYGIWTEDICQYFQDDANAFLSPEFYREMIFESHKIIDSSFPSTLYHIHPVSNFTVDDIVTLPNVKIIEINREPEAVGPSTEELIPAFRKIQESGKAVIVNYTDLDFTPEYIEKDVRKVCESLSNRGLCIWVAAADIPDARRKIKAVEKVFKI